MRGKGRVSVGGDLRRLLRLDDLEDRGLVHAAVFTTHDLNLGFVLTEILPGLLPDPAAIPEGDGPNTRRFRDAMTDLPPIAIVYAPEASTSLDVEWRPPTLDLIPYTGTRRLHAKVAAVLHDDGDKTCLRLVASSANLTRRAFTANLEVAGWFDGELAEGESGLPSHVELRRLLEHLATHSALGKARAFEHVVARLARRADQDEDDLRFVASVEPEAYRRQIAEYLCQSRTRERRTAALIASPFWSAQGRELERFVRDDLQLPPAKADSSVPLHVVLDPRGLAPQEAEPQAVVQREDEPHLTPPHWLGRYRPEGSAVLVPNTLALSRTREGEVAGRGTRGRPLHAKLIATSWVRGGNIRWRHYVGSSNFTASGLGLVPHANLEAGMLLFDDAEDNSLLGEVSRSTDSMLLEVTDELPATAANRTGVSHEHVLAASAPGKQVIAELLSPNAISCEEDPAGFKVTVRAPVELGIEQIAVGKHALENVEPGVWASLVPSLSPYTLLFRVDGLSWRVPLPLSVPLVSRTLQRAGGQRLRDRVLSYWLAQSPVDSEAAEEESLGSAGSEGVGLQGGLGPSLGSWELNRLLLGMRRKLVLAARGERIGVPSPEQLFDWARLWEVLSVIETCHPVDRTYFAIHLRAVLVGYRAAVLRRGQSIRRSIEYLLANDALIQRWRKSTRPDGGWSFGQLDSEASRPTVTLPVAARAELDASANRLFEGVRDEPYGELE